MPFASIRPLVVPGLAALLVWAPAAAARSGSDGSLRNRIARVDRAGDVRVEGSTASVRALKAVTFRVSGLPASERRALVLLCKRLAGVSGLHDAGHQHAFGPVPEVPLSPQEQRVFQAQWESAVRASASLRTPAEARAAGYVQASPFHAGVGTHWIKWSLVGRSFDPAAPSMLLFDGGGGRRPRLVGFSYWVGSRAEPQGFAGPNDHWHRHLSLCFDHDGWLTTASDGGGGCKGFALNGESLWMLHAWVVPGSPNPWGRFAPANLSLCPPPSVPDVLQCQPS